METKVLDHSEFVVILDRSGSMESGKADHEGGLRSFVNDQKDLEGNVFFTLIQFDTHNPCEIVYDRAPINQVKEIHLIPRGGTPLLCAVGLAVAHVSEKLSKLAAKPDQVVVMVITDGEENASNRVSPEWTKARVQELVKGKEKEGWKFLYLGANVDAFAEAGNIGVVATAAMGYTPGSAGIKATYKALHDNAIKTRGAIHANKLAGHDPMFGGVAAQWDFDEKQRTESAAADIQPPAKPEGTASGSTDKKDQ